VHLKTWVVQQHGQLPHETLRILHTVCEGLYGRNRVQYKIIWQEENAIYRFTTTAKPAPLTMTAGRSSFSVPASPRWLPFPEGMVPPLQTNKIHCLLTCFFSHSAGLCDSKQQVPPSVLEKLPWRSNHFQHSVTMRQIFSLFTCCDVEPGLLQGSDLVASRSRCGNYKRERL
jgi:hypothetical protein